MLAELDWWIWHHEPESKTLWLIDHFGSFDRHFRNYYLDLVPPGYTVWSEYRFPDQVHQAYPQLTFQFCPLLWLNANWILSISQTAQTINFTDPNFSTFLSGFFRSDQPERHAVLAELYNRGWFDASTMSKHFCIDVKSVQHFGISFDRLPKKFINKIVSFDFDCPTDHVHNLQVVSPMIKKSFINLVSETKACGTTVCFPTEKFLYPIANHRLWLASAPPNYHKMINQELGFKLYPCFDYYFDSIWQDQYRIQAMFSELDRFSRLSQRQWQKIYQDMVPVIEYNYQRLASLALFDDTVKQEPADYIHTGPQRFEPGVWDRYQAVKKTICSIGAK